MPAEVKHMKWWGWGEQGVSFDLSDRPGVWPFLAAQLGITEPEMTPPVRFEDIHLPAQKRHEPFLADLLRALRPDQLRDDKMERLVHAAGKSFRDLWRLRRGIVNHAPDLVVYPESEADVIALVATAHTHEVVVIPFGGGSNIAGCLEPSDDAGRMVVSLDMGRMNRVLEVDAQSLVARLQPGALGGDMESQLQSHGVTLGHFPDSFLHSTLGGWIATRSAGMQSDKYGKIEEMVVSLRMVTPSGTLVTRTVPKCSNGIDPNHLCIGSEGILGVITEAAMRVHRLPERKAYYGYLFPDFESGVAAIHECVRRDLMPLITRLNDPGKTQLSFAFKQRTTPFKERIARAMKWYLRHVKGIDFSKCCMMIAAFEGEDAAFRQRRAEVNVIYRRHGAASLGDSPGRSFEKSKYDFPHLRDFVMDRGIMADVSETSTLWSNLLPLHAKVTEAIARAIRDTGSQPWIGCHISHNYHAGASLYFTFGAAQRRDRELEQYLYVKKAAEDAFLQHGGTLSHHHAVGTEHLPWIEADLSSTGLHAVRALKAGLDPKNIMNPGKIIPGGNPLAQWGLSAEATRSFRSN
jgi:alkyldihydroxyacetonephosphate synthase